MIVFENAADEYLKISMSKCYLKVRLAIYMMALGALGCTWHIAHVPGASGAQYPPHHALGFRKLVQVHSQVVEQEW